MKIGMIMLHHPPTRKSPIMPKVVRLLSEWGTTVDVIYPEEQLTDLARVRVEHDLYILKSGTDLALSLAGVLHATGGTILKPVPDCGAASRHNNHHPDTAGGRRANARGLRDRPSRGTRPAPGRRAGDPQILPELWGAGRSRHLGHRRTTRRTDQSWPGLCPALPRAEGMRSQDLLRRRPALWCARVWPARTYEDKIGEPFTITPELREIALRCGRAFGLELYGLDLIVSDGHPYVVDVSDFPGFKGVPDAALRLADYIYAAGQRVLNGEPLLPTVEQEVNA